MPIEPPKYKEPNALPVLPKLLQFDREKYTVDRASFRQALFGACHNVAYSRPLAWDFCYKHFFDNQDEYLSGQPSQELLNQGALELASYLGAFGMYRNVKTASVNRQIYVIVLKRLFEKVHELGIQHFSQNTVFNEYELKALIATVHDAFDKAYREAEYTQLGTDTRSDEETKAETFFAEASGTLVTKVLLGTLAALPAFDRNFHTLAVEINHYQKSKFPSKIDIKTSEEKSTPPQIKQTLEPLLAVAKDPEVQAYLRNFVEPYFADANILKIDYPLMRLLDLHFWTVGAVIEMQKKRSKKS